MINLNFNNKFEVRLPEATFLDKIKLCLYIFGIFKNVSTKSDIYLNLGKSKPFHVDIKKVIDKNE